MADSLPILRPRGNVIFYLMKVPLSIGIIPLNMWLCFGQFQLIFLYGCWHYPGGSFFNDLMSHTWNWFCKKSQEEGFQLRFKSKRSLLTLNFKPATFRPRCSSLCRPNFLTRLGYYHGSTRSGHSSGRYCGDHFVAVASKLSGGDSRLSQNM